MAEPFPFSPDEHFDGPEAPAQGLADLACDILVEKGEDQSTEEISRLYATWDDIEGNTLHLHKFERDGRTTFRLLVLSLSESEPVASFRYVGNSKGVTLHDRNSKEIGAPSHDNERAMVKYLQTAKVTTRNGMPNELVNDMFWRIAVDTVLSDPQITDIKESVAASAPAVVRYTKMEVAANYVRRKEMRLPDDILHQALEGEFFPK